MKKLFSVVGIMALVVCIVAVGIVYAGAVTGRTTSSGFEIIDDGSIPVTTGSRNSVYSAGVCSSATYTVRPSRGSFQTLTLASHGTCTIDWFQPSEGLQIVNLIVTQGTASAPMAWTSTLWPGGVASAMTTTTGAIDWFTCRMTGTQVLCDSIKNIK